MIGDLFEKFFQGMEIVSNPNFWKGLIMVLVGFVLLFLAIKKGFEPYLLVPIAVGMILANLAPDLMAKPEYILDADGLPVLVQNGGLLHYLHEGVGLGIFPPLIFLGIGATTDFGPLISRPSSLLLGAAAQIGIFVTFLGALLFGFSGEEAASIGIIGGADGPTAIFLSNTLLGGAKDGEAMCAIIAVVAYSYMALVPVIQPCIIKGLTTKKERSIKMVQSREVSKREKILFPILVSFISIIIVPSAAPLIGMLMLGNLIKECGVVPNLVEACGKTLMYVITVLLGVSVGATASGAILEGRMPLQFLFILFLGLIAFAIATASGVLFGKIMCKVTKGKINPMIGAAGVSAVPMAARVVHKIGQEEDSSNFLLMHAMGPNVAGVIGSAVAAGMLLAIFA